MSPRVWLITGCSTGFGRELVRAVLAKGDKAIATARNVAKLEPLKSEGADIMPLDVTASLEDLKKSAEQAHSLYGRMDVLVNNAGYAMQGTLEELSPAETQAQFDTNVFGLLNVTRAFLPYMRAQKSGVIGNISSIGEYDPSKSIRCWPGLCNRPLPLTTNKDRQVAGAALLVLGSTLPRNGRSLVSASP